MKATACATATSMMLLTALLAVPVSAADGQGTLYPEGSIDKQALEKILPDKPPYSPYADLSLPARPMDKKGTLHEKVCDVAWSGERKPGKDGKLPPVGATVDVREATWTNTIGATELIAAWKDPDFKPEQPAFYYGRVIEIPTPRWTAYDAKYFNLDLPDDVPMTTQERAYTSPIWYTPSLMSI